MRVISSVFKTKIKNEIHWGKEPKDTRLKPKPIRVSFWDYKSHAQKLPDFNVNKWFQSKKVFLRQKPANVCKLKKIHSNNIKYQNLTASRVKQQTVQVAKKNKTILQK